MDTVRVYETWQPGRPTRHVAVVTAVFRDERVKDTNKWLNNWWLSRLVLTEWQRVYEQQGRYFTGD